VFAAYTTSVWLQKIMDTGFYLLLDLLPYNVPERK
jgi:hypothetical protein